LERIGDVSRIKEKSMIIYWNGRVNGLFDIANTAQRVTKAPIPVLSTPLNGES
jgi:hypothetical protein